jgi:hypothetical protein
LAEWLSGALAMEPFKAVTFYKIGRLLSEITHMLGSSSHPGSAFYGETANVSELDESLKDEVRDGLKLILEAVIAECRGIKLCRACEYATDIFNQVKTREGLTNREISTLIRELDKHIRWDMEKESFMYVPPSSARY